MDKRSCGGTVGETVEWFWCVVGVVGYSDGCGIVVVGVVAVG